MTDSPAFVVLARVEGGYRVRDDTGATLLALLVDSEEAAHGLARARQGRPLRLDVGWAALVAGEGTEAPPDALVGLTVIALTEPLEPDPVQAWLKIVGIFCGALLFAVLIGGMLVLAGRSYAGAKKTTPDTPSVIEPPPMDIK